VGEPEEDGAELGVVVLAGAGGGEAAGAGGLAGVGVVVAGGEPEERAHDPLAGFAAGLLEGGGEAGVLPLQARDQGGALGETRGELVQIEPLAGGGLGGGGVS
jgi:hypothetical protein